MELLDMTAIDNLKNLGEQTGKDLLSMLLKIYIDTTPDIILKMKTLLAEKSYEDLAREAHSLKSSSANLGAKQLAEYCKEIEYKIIENENFSPEEITILIEQLSETFPKTLRELEEIS